MSNLNVLMNVVMLLLLSNSGLYGMSYFQSMSEGDKAYLEANGKAAKILQKKYPIRCVGSGVGGKKEIETLALRFYVTADMNIPYARNLIINISEDYLKILNNTPMLRPHVLEYPLGYKNLEVTLFFKRRNGDDSYDPFLRVAGNSKGRLDYCTIEEGKKGYNANYFETYEEALERLKNGNTVDKDEMRRWF